LYGIFCTDRQKVRKIIFKIIFIAGVSDRRYNLGFKNRFYHAHHLLHAILLSAHSFCAVPGPDRQQCGALGIEETECVWGECCWDESQNQCFLPDSTYRCLEQGGRCIPIDQETCNRGIITNDDYPDMCPKVGLKIIQLQDLTDLYKKATSVNIFFIFYRASKYAAT